MASQGINLIFQHISTGMAVVFTLQGSGYIELYYHNVTEFCFNIIYDPPDINI